jgi:general secretion pathway protein G
MIKTLTLNQRRSQGGFSLIEILIVLVIIGTIMGLVASQIFKKGDTANINAAKIQISNIKSALDLYELNMGRLPTTAEGLNALVEKPTEAEEASNWAGGGPYLKEVPKDPFRKQEFKYELNEAGGEPPYYVWTEGKGTPETRIGDAPSK